MFNINCTVVSEWSHFNAIIAFLMKEHCRCIYLSPFFKARMLRFTDKIRMMKLPRLKMTDLWL